MKNHFFLLFSLCFCLPAFAQESAPRATPLLYTDKTISDLDKIQTAALTSDYALMQVKHLSNNIGPRLSGSTQAEQAVQYVAAEMRKLGLEVRLQKVMVPHWVRGQETGELTQWPGMTPSTSQKIVLAALGGSVATPDQGVTAEIVVVDSFDDLARLGRDKIKGRIVLFNNKYDREMAESGFGGAAYGQAVAYRFGGAAAAARFGAVAALVRSAGASQNRLVHTGAMGYEEGVEKIPTAAVTFEDAETIADLAGQGTVRMHLLLTPQTLPDAPSYNVIADLKGSEKPDEIVVVSGHLDSWDLGRGAIDDGAGVAMSMETPFILKQLGLKPKRTIRFIAWMNEENGGRGSAAYAQAEKANMDKHFGAIEADLGASHPVGLMFAGKPDAMPFLAPIVKVLWRQGAGIVQPQANVGSDVGPMTELGVPSFAPYFDQRTYFLYHHTAADTFDKIVPKEMAENASLVAVLAYGLANLEVPLPR